MGVSISSPTLCHVLAEAPELAESLPTRVRERATSECVAPELRIAPGSWEVEGSLAPQGTVGLLVLSGLMIRRVGIDGRTGV